LSLIIAPIDKPAVKRLAFNLETSRVNAALGQILVSPYSNLPLPKTFIPAPFRPRECKSDPERSELRLSRNATVQSGSKLPHSNSPCH
jgi:hypothetical protein